MFPAAILCGGLAKRLGSVTASVPKSLISICGEAFLGHQLRLLRDRGIDEAVLCVGHLGHMIQDFAGDGSKFGLHLSYSEDGQVLLGTAGAIKRALPFLGECFFVIYGDSYLPCDYEEVARQFNNTDARGLMTVYRNEGRFDSSNVEYEAGRIIRYDKRNRTPAMAFIDYGLGVFRRAAFRDVPGERPFDLADVYAGLLAEDSLAAAEIGERFYEIGSAQGIADLERYLCGKVTVAGQSHGARQQ
jgi:MurNAc alpha-1-phosphate uridylyltransferase